MPRFDAQRQQRRRAFDARASFSFCWANELDVTAPSVAASADSGCLSLGSIYTKLIIKLGDSYWAHGTQGRPPAGKFQSSTRRFAEKTQSS